MNSIVLPELVQKNIAEFLEPIKKSCTIRIQQNAGCIKGEHSTYRITDRCSYCSKRYVPGQIFFYLKKGGDKHLFEKWINKIKKDCINDNYNIKHNSDGYFRSFYLSTQPKFKDLFNEKKMWLGKTELFSWENEDFECKYTLEGLHFSLFRDFVYNLSCLDEIYDSYHFRWERTIDSASIYTDVFIEENIKNPLYSVNKIFNKYCKKT
jgi:hypothetical protein